jgi:hypothetical protein
MKTNISIKTAALMALVLCAFIPVPASAALIVGGITSNAASDKSYGLGTQILRLRADQSVLAVRLVPDRVQRHSAPGGGLDG